MAYSGSLNYSISTIVPNLAAGDVITFELINEYQPQSGNWTGSLNIGNLTVDLQPILIGGYPYATSSIDYGNFISGTIAPNILIFNSNITSFLQNYQQIPYFLTGSDPNTSIVSSSLYSQYGDINYPFNVSFGDKIVIQSLDGRTQILDIYNNKIVNNQLWVYVSPDLDNYFILTPENITKVLIIKKIQDEQNIILTFNKPLGQTSYGFVISDITTGSLLNNISSLQTNVQQQLLSTQANTI